MRREATRVRKLYPFQEDMFWLPPATSERKAVRGDQDRPETHWGRGSECAATHPRARQAASQTSREIPATYHAADDAEYAECRDVAVPPHHESPVQ